MMSDEVLMDYLESALDAAAASRTPFFTLSMASVITHDDLNGISVLDGTYANFLNRIIEKGYLKNTILIMLGDHGYRYGGFRKTVNGYFEQNLPNMWIRLPPRIQKRFPHWQRSLEINAK
jgi:membrane-anchored protein YejM (alkaline phosphatase superfamily)